MTYPNAQKVPLLREFFQKLRTPGWTIKGNEESMERVGPICGVNSLLYHDHADVGDSPEYRTLLAHFDKVIRVFLSLEKRCVRCKIILYNCAYRFFLSFLQTDRYQVPIEDICMRMGEGMAEFAEKKVTTVDGYNLYCHYVAGLVGYGLSDLFAASTLEGNRYFILWYVFVFFYVR